MEILCKLHKLPHYLSYGIFISFEFANKTVSYYWLDQVHAHRGILKIIIQFSLLYYNSVVPLLVGNTTDDSAATTCPLEETECHFER